MSSSTTLPGLGPLSNREPHYQNQSTLVVDEHGRVRFAALSRRVLALPLEILSEIFIHCLPDSEFMQPDTNSAPLILLGVCRKFRAVALTTPKLWSSLNFDIQMATRTEFADLLRVWLPRARSAPLSLCLHDSDGGQASDSVLSILHTIVDLSPQWCNVDLYLARYWTELLLPLEGKFPSLEKLTITLLGDFHGPISFRDAPRLREVDAPYYHPGRHSRVQLPWNQLITFRTGDIVVSSCFEVLRDASNLRDGTFEFWDYDSSTLPITILRLAHLRSLALTEVISFETLAAAKPLAILDCLEAPALESLTLRLPHDPDSVPALDTSLLVSFVTRSSLQLHTLVLSLTPTADFVIQCLKVLPSLVHLKIEPMHAVDMNTIFPQLIGDSDFLPKLESLHIIFSNLHDRPCPSSSTVIRMLRWRWAGAGVTQLRSFQLAHKYLAPDFDQAVNSHSKFQRLAAEGMDLYVGEFRPTVDWVAPLPRQFVIPGCLPG
ncbi:hypothetical protein FB451DRAFT_1562906 [Mycena latifolia]|nr:hypothetical protein FB451DRAFT_1562906 [Mycena latifolia]